MIIGTGIFLWSVALVVVVRLIVIGRAKGVSSRFMLMMWGGLSILAIILLFRPHEDIFGGEDPGAYINSGITYGRQRQFFYVDPLLAQVPPDIRPVFYYGHAGYGTTKDACLWVREPDRAVIGPHFQPAYPLLIASMTRIGNASWALYVIPIFTLFLALALWALAAQLLPHRLAGLIACLLFLFNPLTLWHGRCSRPEIIAGFMFFGGYALLLYAWRNRRWRQWGDVLLGATAICLAPFFHITAGFLIIPAAIMVAIVILRGRDDFLLCPLVALLGIAVFVYQMKWVTDYYGIGRFLDPLIFRPALAYGLFGLGLGSLALLCGLRRRVRTLLQPPPENSSGQISLTWSLGLAGATTLIILVTAFTRDTAGSLPILGRPIEHYLYMADFKTFANMVSMPIAVLALCGWILWLTGTRQYRAERIVMALVLFPAIIFSGNVRDFMMTRYWFVALIPMSVLGLTALATSIPDRKRMAWLAVIGAMAICLLGLYQRTHLMTQTDYQGLTRFLKPYATIIAREKGILLCEYSRLAAPFEHLFGIPTLGLDNERRDDYSPAEQAWETIMKKYPDRPAFFISPFPMVFAHQTRMSRNGQQPDNIKDRTPPLAERFYFIPEKTSELHYRKLQQARQSLPTRINDGVLTLNLYRMQLKSSLPSVSTPLQKGNSYEASLHPGNMGFRHFANLRVGDRYQIEGLALTPGTALQVPLASVPDVSKISEIIFLLMADAATPSVPAVVGLSNFVVPPENNPAIRFQQLPAKWWALRIQGKALATNKSLTLTLRVKDPLFLADIFVVSDSQAVSLRPQLFTSPITRQAMPFITARWARAEAQVLLPVPAGQPGLLLMLFEPPLGNSKGLTTRLTVSAGALLPATSRNVAPGRWQWLVCPYPVSTSTTDVAWVTLNTEPAWNSGQAGFPQDLGVLIGHIVVLPPL